ncbi:UDP-4-amino-4,6-dideoxy-N-acetyl-beta-L-altrosami ne transaminase [Shewanella sp. NFH-SH190041]|uniref:UDP-4-amino-4, 6-dideoxy-N-acetyl-beta-L-altrosamine transaminase n=1 Tax=Shewanella sp. NFH-SH190041 TaxID=2950245 RepID=UPI0021C3C972|nr:UDP-4-amino-4,6-dideoxy-N-acetyl-beta-L-altrosamine transaminase [Shewanella sp. NFH-SH190041]BDM62926.1 UDP-4-amino-4,6-dideoxy-N-acetyl-beta-L-altrosami ne transaminase [Shewanella sp. NFH-SH190041]
MIPYGKQSINQQDIDAVINVLTSDFLTQGPKVPEFESKLSSLCKAKFAFAVNSATSALHIACCALGLGKGDWLWTSPITFVASANCGLYCGASIDFVDVDEATYNMCPRKLEEKLIVAKQQGRLPKIVIPVHLCGQSCDMEAIFRLSQEYGFKIIEDASHAIGGFYKGEPIGNCAYSDMTVFSFHPVKIITTAEGGAVLTNNAALAEKLALLRSHGVTRNTDLMEGESHGAWYYEQVALGFNYRMTELQGALGASQISRLSEFVQKRHKLAERYNQRLADLPIVLPKQHTDTYSSFHLYIIRLKLNLLTKSRKQIFDELRDADIGVNVHYIPVHTQPYYQSLGFTVGDFPVAERFYSEAISLPLYADMTDTEQNEVISILTRVLA